MTIILPNLVKEKDTQVQEAQIPNMMGPKKPTSRHMANLKDKERILKATSEKQLINYKGAPMRMSSDFSTETFI